MSDTMIDRYSGVLFVLISLVPSARTRLCSFLSSQEGLSCAVVRSVTMLLDNAWVREDCRLSKTSLVYYANKYEE